LNARLKHQLFEIKQIKQAPYYSSRAKSTATEVPWPSTDFPSLRYGTALQPSADGTRPLWG